MRVHLRCQYVLWTAAVCLCAAVAAAAAPGGGLGGSSAAVTVVGRDGRRGDDLRRTTAGRKDACPDPALHVVTPSIGTVVQSSPPEWTQHSEDRHTHKEEHEDDDGGCVVVDVFVDVNVHGFVRC